MVAGLLREAGYGVVMLARTCPCTSSPKCARRHQPDVICLSATMPGGGDSVLLAIHEIEREWPTAGFLVGGRDISSRLRSRPGISACEDITQAVEEVDALVKRADLN